MKAVDERSSMDDLRTRALLVDFDPARTGISSVGTILTRAELAETAARGEFPATLLLDVDRIGTDDGREVTAHAQVAVEWDEETLNRLLSSTEDDEIALWFDEPELAQAFDDVEGHGLRQRAAVVAIAVVAAGASTTPAFASVQADTSGGGATTATAAQVSHAPRELQVNQQTVAAATASEAKDAAASSSGGGGLSSGEVAAIAAGAGAVLISAAGFGVARKRMPPVHPA
jgi:hypothetical protein